ncbi:MAG: hypothetical protein ACI4P1_05675 [Erysipelotrichaceae bacterium]
MIFIDIDKKKFEVYFHSELSIRESFKLIETLYRYENYLIYRKSNGRLVDVDTRLENIGVIDGEIFYVIGNRI